MLTNKKQEPPTNKKAPIMIIGAFEYEITDF